MRRAAVWGVLTLALAMVLGVGSAGGRTATITTITLEVIGQGQVTSDQPGLECGKGKDDCYAAFSGTGSSLDLKATPDDNWIFEMWGATYDTDICGPPNHCAVPLDGNAHVITASFQGPSTGTSTLSVNFEGQGTVTGGEINCGLTHPLGSLTDCNWSVLAGSTLTVHETPDVSASPGWVFAGWGTTACKQVGDACTIKMAGDQPITPTWVQPADISTLSITANGSGTVTGNGITCHGPGSCIESEPKNSTITLHASPDSGYVFTGWTGDCLGAGEACNLTMDDDRAVVANFALAVNLTVTVSGEGNVSGGAGAINCGNGDDICSANFAQNATVTLTATPALGSTFTGWTGACGGTVTSCTVLMSQSRNVTATFGTSGGFLLTVSVWGPGAVNGPGISCGNGGTVCSATPTAATVTLTATPAPGATFIGWGGACSGIGTVPTCAVQMTAARSVIASFATGGGGGPTVLLSVSFVGSGTVTGAWIQCGNSSGTCSVRLPAGSAVTLIATPTVGASFTSWGGACSGSALTCTVSMTSAKTVSATFSTAATPGTLAITVQARGTVSAPLGKCIGTGVTKTCLQKYAAGRTVTLTAAAAAGNRFAGWAGACLSAARRVNCTITLNTAKSVTARFVPVTAGGGGGGVSRAVLTSLGPPIVRQTTTGFGVTLRFNTARAGIARVFGLRAGRIGARVTFRIAAGPARIGPFTVAKPGLYTFQVRLGTASLQWRVCLGRCGAAAPPPQFILVRKPPTFTRSGDAWSVTLHVHSNQISVARVRAVRGGEVLVDQNFLAKAGDISLGPFLLGPGSYTLRLNATDAYGRTRNLTWVVALAS